MTALRAALLVTALGAGLLTGCTDDKPSVAPSPSATPSPSASATAEPSASAPASATPSVPFTADTRVDTEEPSGGPLGVKVARAARQDGYDRVVIELGGKNPGKPGWRVEYVDQPTSDGSGQPVAVKGSAFLRVLVTGTGYPDDTGVPEPAVRRFTPSGTTTLREVVLDGVYEGQYTAFLGLTGKRPFRVFRLDGPPRVVIDVRDS